MATLPKPQLNALPLGAHSVSALTDEGLFQACGVRIAFMGRAGGVSEAPYASLNTADHVGDDLSNVLRNRSIVLEALGHPDVALVSPKQVHGADIVHVANAADVPAAQAQAAEGADAVMVEVPEVAALLSFADCLPLIIVAPSGRFAVVHAGWRGAYAGISGKAARALAQAEGEGSAVDFNAYIGPHIRSKCFETSAEIARQFADRFGADVLAGEQHVSLARVVTHDLVQAGMREERIADAGICTVCNTDSYFSYRAEGTTGRHSAVAIRKAI